MKNEIHTSAEKALKGGIMDKEIYDADIIEAFASQRGQSIESYLDIPIENLIALRSRDFYAPGSSWRKAALSLHCRGWDEFRADIVRYFTSDLLDKSFPPLDSHEELRIGFTGGAIYCKLGNHRAVAAKAWLAHNCSERAILKKAKCYYRKICPPLRELMNKCLAEGSTLKYAHVSSDCGYLRGRNICDVIMVKKRFLCFEIYNLNTEAETLELVVPGKNLIFRLLKLDLLLRCSRLKFKKIPTRLIEIMLDESKADELFHCAP